MFAKERMSDSRKRKKVHMLDHLALLGLVICVRTFCGAQRSIVLPPYDPSVADAVASRLAADFALSKWIFDDLEIDIKNLSHCLVKWINYVDAKCQMDWMKGICKAGETDLLLQCVQVKTINGALTKQPIEKGDVVILSDYGILFGYLVSICTERTILPKLLRFTTASAVQEMVKKLGSPLQVVDTIQMWLWNVSKLLPSFT